MNIRLATKEDLETVIQLTNELAIYEKEGDTFDARDQFFLDNVLGENSKLDCYLMEENGEVIGMGELYVTLATYMSGYKLNLQDFYIKPDYRGKGYGKAFMKFLASEAKKRNCMQICWGVYSWNELARNLYDKVGNSHEDVTVYSMNIKQIESLL